MQGPHPLADDETKPHGLKAAIQAGQRNPVIGMIKVKAEQKPKHATMVKILGGRQDCNHPIEDGAASFGAELGHMEDTGKE